MAKEEEEEALYMISIAAKLAGLHPQTLRLYERKELICPRRSLGDTRLYSDEDVDTLKNIQKLTQEFRVNLAGVRFIFDLDKDINELRKEIDEAQEKLKEMKKEMEEKIRKVQKSLKKELMIYPKGELIKR